MRGNEKEVLQTETGNKEGSILFELTTIVPYNSFPIDIMHLFNNIAKNVIRAWVSSQDETYSHSKTFLRNADAELLRFGDGVPSQQGNRPRPLSWFAEWKSAEVKDIILAYSHVVRDGHLSDEILSGWRSFVELVDIW